MLHSLCNHLLCIKCMWTVRRQIPNRLSVIYHQYSVFFDIVNIDIGIRIFKIRYQFGFLQHVCIAHIAEHCTS